MVEPVVLVHGGAGNIPASRVAGKIKGVKLAAQIGYKILNDGGSVIDAVEAAVRSMEDDEQFNAGYGSVLNLDGKVEMEASIMEGSNLKSGSVSLLKDIEHPISLARLVMEKTPHAFLASDGAEKFAQDQGVPKVQPASLISENAKQALQNFIEQGGIANTEIGPTLKQTGSVGTVGAVAVDSRGHVAVATSTGGINGKMVGRIGDTPLIGSGSYADDNVGAVSTTGHGESILKFCLAHSIIKAIENGQSTADATTRSVKAMTDRLKNTAGAIAVSSQGDIGVSFSSKRMAWAYQRANEIHFGIDPDQHEQETTV